MLTDFNQITAGKPASKLGIKQMAQQEKIINHDGDTWRVIGMGANIDGKTFCHLASTTRGRQQKNGFYPIQRGCFIENEILNDESKT